MSTPATATLPKAAAPFKGLEAYEFADKDIFLGREQEVKKLIRLVTMYRGVLLFGVQGCGKSSLISAGFLPRAVEEGFAPERLRLQPRAGEEIVISRIKTGEPSRFLPSMFGSETEHRSVLSLSKFLERLSKVPDGIDPLLIFDQFEELISLFDESPTGEVRRNTLAMQDAIIRSLVTLARAGQGRVKLLFVFRHDYLAKLSKIFIQVPNLLTTGLLLEPLPVERLKDVIGGPFGRFPGAYPPEFEPPLISDLVNRFTERSDEKGELNLSEVQIVCRRLWQQPALRAELSNRGIDGVLQDYFSAVTGALPRTLKRPAVAILRELVTGNGVRNVVSSGDLLARARKRSGYRPVKLQQALSLLEQDSHLIRHERRGDLQLYEIVSESLIPWIQEQVTVERLRRGLKRTLWVIVAAALLVAGSALAYSNWKITDRTSAVIRSVEVQRLRSELNTSNTTQESLRTQYEQMKRTHDTLVAAGGDSAKVLRQKDSEIDALKASFAQQTLALQSKSDELSKALTAARVDLQSKDAQLAQAHNDTQASLDERDRKSQQQIQQLLARATSAEQQLQSIRAGVSAFEPLLLHEGEFALLMPQYFGSRVAVVLGRLPPAGGPNAWSYVMVGESSLAGLHASEGESLAQYFAPLADHSDHKQFQFDNASLRGIVNGSVWVYPVFGFSGAKPRKTVVERSGLHFSVWSVVTGADGKGAPASKGSIAIVAVPEF